MIGKADLGDLSSGLTLKSEPMQYVRDCELTSNRKTRADAVRKGLWVDGQQKNQTEPRRSVVACELLAPFSF